MLGNGKGTLLPSSQTRATFYVAIYIISKKLETCLSLRGKIMMKSNCTLRYVEAIFGVISH